MTDSPVNTLLKKLIHFEKSSATPVYIQISQQIINAIQRSYLAGGTLLPGTRVFSQLIQINRNSRSRIRWISFSRLGWHYCQQRHLCIRSRTKSSRNKSGFEPNRRCLQFCRSHWISLSNFFSFIIKTRIFRSKVRTKWWSTWFKTTSYSWIFKMVFCCHETQIIDFEMESKQKNQVFCFWKPIV